jgi:hypothetical protein
MKITFDFEIDELTVKKEGTSVKGWTTDPNGKRHYCIFGCPLVEVPGPGKLLRVTFESLPVEEVDSKLLDGGAK